MDFEMEETILPLYKKPIDMFEKTPNRFRILCICSILLVVIICVVAFILLRDSNEKKDLGEIKSLPGAPAVNFKQYSDFVKLKSNRRIHYWFIESQNNPATDPLILWLTGGPGCSGMFAILTEWGPQLVNDDGETLRSNPYSWNKNASLLTVEMPAGVGYSTGTNETDFNDDQVALDNWEVLTLFFQKFPSFKANKLYVMGESYGGVFAPTLVELILNRMDEFPMNIKGMAIGNGKLDYSIQTNSRILFRYNHGLLKKKIYDKALVDCCNGTFEQCDFQAHKEDSCSWFAEKHEDRVWYSSVNPYNIQKPCHTNATKYYAPHCLNTDPISTYLNREDVRKALNIPNSLKDWEVCSRMAYTKTYRSMSSQIKYAINNGLKAMLYNGDLDMVCDYLMGEIFTQRLNYEVTKPKSEYHVNGASAGNHTEYINRLHFVTVKDAGHMVPTDQPAAAFHILQSFLFDKEF